MGLQFRVRVRVTKIGVQARVKVYTCIYTIIGVTLSVWCVLSSTTGVLECVICYIRVDVSVTSIHVYKCDCLAHC